MWNRGGSDDATFVQIRQGVSSDPARLRHLYVNEQPVRMGPYRPEVLGGLFFGHPEPDRFTDTHERAVVAIAAHAATAPENAALIARLLC